MHFCGHDAGTPLKQALADTPGGGKLDLSALEGAAGGRAGEKTSRVDAASVIFQTRKPLAHI
jgi:hypothetical protein